MPQDDLEILFEDNHLIAINKRPSVLVQGDQTGDRPLNEMVKSYLKEKYNKPGDVYLGIIHRIDRPVSGVVVFARTSKAASRMSRLFKNREIEKTYWAVVKNKPEPEHGQLEHFLKKNRSKNMSVPKPEGTKGASKAVLEYRLLADSDHYYLLEVKPITGRHHQIRVQLSAAGMPIKGDIKYGFKRTNDDASIHLHARKISFIHPVRKEPLEITAPPPRDVLWDHFSKI